MRPIIRTVNAVAFALIFGAAPALAEGDKIVTSTREETSGDNAGHYVDFSYDCGEECYAATLWCNGNGTLNAELAEVAPQNVTKVINSKDQSYSMTIGAKAFKMFVQELSFSQMSGAWEVRSYARVRQPRGLCRGSQGEDHRDEDRHRQADAARQQGCHGLGRGLREVDFTL